MRAKKMATISGKLPLAVLTLPWSGLSGGAKGTENPQGSTASGELLARVDQERRSCWRRSAGVAGEG